MKILHLPRMVGNNAAMLSKGEKLNGAKESLILVTDPPNLLNSGKADYVIAEPTRLIPYLYEFMKFCVKIHSRVDVVHYNYGKALIQCQYPFLYHLDVKYFKRKKKVIVVHYQGSDAILPSYFYKYRKYSWFTKEEVESEKNIIKEKRICKSRNSFAKYADLIYTSQPDIISILPEGTKFRPLTKLFPDEITPVYSDYSKDKLKIIHAPSNMTVKGTKYIIDAIEMLKSDGYEIDFILIENMKNDEAIEVYKQADLCIDQLIVGWYGGLSVELMALGKPCFCYICEDDMRFIPEQMNIEMPIIRVEIDTLYDKLKYYLEHKEELVPIAKASRAYVEKWHDSKKIAKDLMKDYQEVLNKKRIEKGTEDDN